MKKQTHTTAAVRSQFSGLRQIGNLIPTHLVPKLARETGTDRLCPTFSAWSHCTALRLAQLTHALGRNDGCDSLRLHSEPLSAVRGATPPSRHNLSHASKQRPAELGQKLFWGVLGHLPGLSKGFATGRGRRAHRFRAATRCARGSSAMGQPVAASAAWASPRPSGYRACARKLWDSTRLLTTRAPRSRLGNP